MYCGAGQERDYTVGKKVYVLQRAKTAPQLAKTVSHGQNYHSGQKLCHSGQNYHSGQKLCHSGQKLHYNGQTSIVMGKHSTVMQARKRDSQKYRGSKCAHLGSPKGIPILGGLGAYSPEGNFLKRVQNGAICCSLNTREEKLKMSGGFLWLFIKLRQYFRNPDMKMMLYSTSCRCHYRSSRGSIR